MNTIYRLWQAFGRFASMLDGLSATGEAANARARLHLELPPVATAQPIATPALPLSNGPDDPDAVVPTTRRLPLNGHTHKVAHQTAGKK
jgi:hypothetical protein